MSASKFSERLVNVGLGRAIQLANMLPLLPPIAGNSSSSKKESVAPTPNVKDMCVAVGGLLLEDTAPNTSQ